MQWRRHQMGVGLDKARTDRWLGHLRSLTREPPSPASARWFGGLGNDGATAPASATGTGVNRTTSDGPFTGSSSSSPNDPLEIPTTFSRANLKPQGWNRLVIHPDSRIKSAFETFIVACVLYTAILEPIKVTYMLDILPQVDTFLDLLFVFDLGIQFISGCEQPSRMKHT